LALHDAGRELSPAAERLKAILVETLTDSLHGSNRALAG
jgi:hypothetical protein